MLDFQSFLKQGQSFASNIFDEALAVGLPAETWDCDHLCFRVATSDEYLDYKNFLLQNGKLLSEAQVNGRAICTFLLNTPFEIASGKVFVVELPAPKKNSPYETGFEHIEIVMKQSFQNLKESHSTLQWGNPTARILNSELSLKLKSGQVKFHHLSLQRVIEIEECKWSDIVFDVSGTLSDFQNRLVPGIQELLLILKTQNFRLHIWTSRSKNSTVDFLERNKIIQHFSSLSCGQGFLQKPDLENFQGLLPETHQNFIMVGDSLSDIEAGANLKGLKAVALWCGGEDKNYLLQAGAEIFLNHPKDLEKFLKEIGRI